MKKNLKSILKEQMNPVDLKEIIRSYDVIGDIAIIRIPENLQSKSPIIADAIMQTQKHVKTVFRQASAVSGDFRLRQLEWIAGEKRTETLYKEFSCIFKVDVEQCYFSPRLSQERMRIARLVQPGEIAVNMFAGVGSFSILMAKHSKAKKVYSVDLNPVAVQFMKENIRLNKVGGQVVPILGDARNVITERLNGMADRVIMPLPEKAFEYIDCAVMALKSKRGWIHYYEFEHAYKTEHPVEKVKAKITDRLRRMGVTDFAIRFGRVVRATGPNWYQIGLDVELTPSGEP